MAALGLPAALLLGLLTDLAAALVRDRRLGSVRGSIADLWSDLRRLVARREAAGLVEAVGALGALLGAGLVGAASLGAGPGSIALVYLALAMTAAGAHLAASVPRTKVGAARAAAARRDAALAEIAVVPALGAGFLRWSADGLDAVRGAQEVLGTGFQVGPPTVTAGLMLGAAALLGAGALRLPPRKKPRERGWPAGSAVLLRVSRWSVSGAVVLVAATLVAGRDAVGAPPDPMLAAWAGAAVASAALVGAARAALDRVGSRRARALLPAGLAAAAAGAVLLVTVG